jgi:hypothetical protein
MGLHYNLITAKEAKTKALEQVDVSKITRVFDYIRNASAKGKIEITIKRSEIEPLVKLKLEGLGYKVEYYLGDDVKIKWNEA